MNMGKGVADRTSDLLVVSSRRRVVETLRGGEVAMRAAGEEFVPRNTLEGKGDYEKRLRMAELYNAVKLAVQQVVGRIFSKPITLGDDVPRPLVEWLEDADLHGNNFHEFLRGIGEDMWWSGLGLVLVDSPRRPVRSDGLPISAADEGRMKLRPYVVALSPSNLLQVQMRRIGGAVKPGLIRLLEKVDIPGSSPWESKSEDRVRVYRRDESGVYCSVWAERQSEGGGGKQWVEIEQEFRLIGVQEIPIVPFPIFRRDGFWSAPPFEDLAWMNVHHWQRASDLACIEHVANVPVPVVTGGSQLGKDGALVPLLWSASGMLQLSQGATYGYFEHSGKCIGEMKATQRRTEELMRAFSLQPFLPQASGTQTATGEAIRMAESQSLVLSSVGTLEDGAEQVIRLMMMFATSGRSDAAGSVVFNRDIGFPGGSVEEGRLLADLVDKGQITRDTLWRELIRRGTLGPDFDALKEAEALRVAGIGDLPLVSEQEPEPEQEPAKPEPEPEE